MVDESQHALHALVHHPYSLLQLCLPAVGFHDTLLLLERALHQGERSTELVGYIGEEDQLVASELLLKTDSVAKHILVVYKLHHQDDDTQNKQHINHYRPGRKIERRLDTNNQRTLLTPGAIRRTCLDMQNILASRQFLISRPGRGRRFAPCLVEAFQTIGILHIAHI